MSNPNPQSDAPGKTPKIRTAKSAQIIKAKTGEETLTDNDNNDAEGEDDQPAKGNAAGRPRRGLPKTQMFKTKVGEKRKIGAVEEEEEGGEEGEEEMKGLGDEMVEMQFDPAV